MPRFDRRKRQFLISKLGEERVLQMESALSSFSKELEHRGVAWKGAQPQAAGQHSASPAAPYVSDLMRRRPPSAKALKRITDSHPFIGLYLGDLVRNMSNRSSGWEGSTRR